MRGAGDSSSSRRSAAHSLIHTSTQNVISLLVPSRWPFAGECTFSALGGGAHLKPHCGSTNARLTCHLPLLCPSGSSIRCGDEERAYQEGELLVFDDSWEHEVWQRNQPDSVRVVLLIRFWHPDIPPPRYPEVHHHMKKAYLQHKRRILLPPLQRVTEESSRP